MKITHLFMFKSVCHEIVLVKGVRQMLTKGDDGGRGVNQKMTEDDRGGRGVSQKMTQDRDGKTCRRCRHVCAIFFP